MSNKEVLKVKKDNYGAYYLQPDQFERKNKMLDKNLRKFNPEFKRKWASVQPREKKNRLYN